MKIIATSIVLLAAAASAGEPSLRSGRKLPQDSNAGGNGNGKNDLNAQGTGTTGTGLGYNARCCDHSVLNNNETLCEMVHDWDDNPDDECDGTSCCDMTGMKTSFEDKFKSGFQGCVYNSTASKCIHNDTPDE